jgi:hypothetical protein
MILPQYGGEQPREMYYLSALMIKLCTTHGGALFVEQVMLKRRCRQARGGAMMLAEIGYFKLQTMTALGLHPIKQVELYNGCHVLCELLTSVVRVNKEAQVSTTFPSVMGTFGRTSLYVSPYMGYQSVLMKAHMPTLGWAGSNTSLAL